MKRPAGAGPALPRARAVAAALLPGLLAGTHVAGLLFFLNPDLRFTTASVAAAIGLYGGLGMLASGLLSAWAVVRAPRRLLRSLPWTLAAVLAAAAVLDGVHAAHYAFYLPAGINERLLKAALWLSLAALICFYTALLHGIHRRPYGRRSRIGLALVVLASVYAMLERRDAFEPPVYHEPRASAVVGGLRPRLAVVGIESATLDALLPLAEQGELPFLRSLLSDGASARLRSQTPLRRSTLWTTLATGLHPYHHGISGRTAVRAELLPGDPLLRLLPRGIGFRKWGLFGATAVPLTADLRRGLAAWEILPRLGFDTAVVGWPVSSPLSPDLVFGFSDEFFAGSQATGTATPPEAAQRGSLFQLQGAELDPALVEDFGSRPPRAVLEALAGDLWRETLLNFLLEQHGEADAVFISLPGLLTVQSRFYGGYAAAQFSGDSSDLAQQSASTVAAYYRHLDTFLADLWRRLGSSRMLAVVSVHGVEPPADWRRSLNRSARARLRGRLSGSADGILLLGGEGVEAGAFLQRIDLVDVLPTLLYGLGAPLARDLDGRVRTDAYTSEALARRPLTYVPSYSTLEAP